MLTTLSRDHHELRPANLGMSLSQFLDIPQHAVLLLVHVSPSDLLGLVFTSKSMRMKLLGNRYALFRCYTSYYGSFPLALTKTLEHRYLAVDVDLVELFLTKIRYLHVPIAKKLADPTYSYPKEVRDTIASRLLPAELEQEVAYSRTFGLPPLPAGYCDSLIWLKWERWQDHYPAQFLLPKILWDIFRADPVKFIEILQCDQMFGTPYFGDCLKGARCADFMMDVHYSREELVAFMQFVHQLQKYLPLMNPFSSIAHCAYRTTILDTEWTLVKSLVVTQKRLEKLVWALIIEHPEYARWERSDTWEKIIRNGMLVDFLQRLRVDPPDHPGLRVDLAVETVLLSVGFLDRFVDRQAPECNPSNLWYIIWRLKDRIGWLEPVLQKLFHSLVTEVVDRRIINRYQLMVLQVMDTTEFKWSKKALSTCPAGVHRQLILLCWPIVYRGWEPVVPLDAGLSNGRFISPYKHAYRALVAAYEGDVCTLLQEIKSSPEFQSLPPTQVMDFNKDFEHCEPPGLYASRRRRRH